MITNPKKPKEQLKIKVRPRPFRTAINWQETTAPAAKVVAYNLLFWAAGLFYRFCRRFRMVNEYREAFGVLLPSNALKHVNEKETLRTNDFMKRWANRMKRAGIIVVNY